MKLTDIFSIKGVEVVIKNQRFDGYECWVKRGESDWIRIDFMLEYFINKAIPVTNQFNDRESLRDKEYARQYYSLFLDTYIDNLSNPDDFDFKNYREWMENNPSEINKARKLFALK